jgi:phosphohistidine phosphatase
MELHLIRHAAAAERGPDYPDDTQRPLITKGERQARELAESLARGGVRVDLLASSPWLRAWQTASALAPLVRGGEPLALPELAQGDPARTAAALLAAAADAGASEDACIAAVGHEPWLSCLAAHLLGADEVAPAIAFRKAAVMTLSGELHEGGMRIEALVPMRLRRRLR